MSDFFKDLIVAIIPPTILGLAAWREAALSRKEAREARKQAAEVLRLLKKKGRKKEK